MIRTIPKAMLTRSQDWTFFGKRPGGFGFFSVMGSFMVSLSLCGCLAREDDALFAHGEIAGIENFRDDVDAVRELEVDEARLAVFDFIERWFFLGGALDVGEGVVVVDHRH